MAKASTDIYHAKKSVTSADLIELIALSPGEDKKQLSHTEMLFAYLKLLIEHAKNIVLISHCNYAVESGVAVYLLKYNFLKALRNMFNKVLL